MASFGEFEEMFVQYTGKIIWVFLVLDFPNADHCKGAKCHIMGPPKRMKDGTLFGNGVHRAQGFLGCHDTLSDGVGSQVTRFWMTLGFRVGVVQKEWAIKVHHGMTIVMPYSMRWLDVRRLLISVEGFTVLINGGKLACQFSNSCPRWSVVSFRWLLGLILML